jgi:Domain of unknown function (DUF4129)
MRFLFLYLCVLLFYSGLSAQSGEPAPRFSEQQWERLVENLDYSKDVPEQRAIRTDQSPEAPRLNAYENLGKILQILAILIAIGAVGVGIYRMLQTPRNRVVARDGVEITLENIEQYIHETDLERFLREALANQNYAQAVRLYYLQVIKNFSEQKAIFWSREKTNSDYLRELKSHRLFVPFRHATGLFEQVWYGNGALDAEQFARMEPAFKSLAQTSRGAS